MNILFVPSQRQPAGTWTNERTPSMFRVLSSRYNVEGPPMPGFVPGGPIWRRFGIPLYYLRLCLFALRNRHRTDVIFCNGVWHVPAAFVASVVTRAPLIVDWHSNPAVLGRAIGRPRVVRAISLAFQRLARRTATAHIVVSDREKELFVGDGFAPEKVHVIPTAADMGLLGKNSGGEQQALSPTGRSLLFTGRRTYGPNAASAAWIATCLAPAISSRFNDVSILMTGSEPLPENSPANVQITGWVSNIYELITAADVCIAPTWSGDGIFTKVLDALACGRPTVVTRLAVDGMPELRDGENCLIAVDESEFMSKTIFLLRHPELGAAIGDAGKMMVESSYNWSVWKTSLYDILERIARRS